MNKKQFWQLISEMNQQNETRDWFIEQLAAKSTSEITDYEIHFQTAFQQEEVPLQRTSSCRYLSASRYPLSNR